MLDQWVLCTSVERFYFWHIRNIVVVFLPFFPWNVQRAHNAYSNLISLSIPTIIKKMLKLHLSAQRNLWWREVEFFLNLLLCQHVCSWIGSLAEWCQCFSLRRGKKGLFLPQRALIERYCYTGNQLLTEWCSWLFIDFLSPA